MLNFGKALFPAVAVSPSNGPKSLLRKPSADELGQRCGFFYLQLRKVGQGFMFRV